MKSPTMNEVGLSSYDITLLMILASRGTRCVQYSGCKWVNIRCVVYWDYHKSCILHIEAGICAVPTGGAIVINIIV